MYDTTNGLQGGFTFSEYERQKLNDLKRTDPVPKHEFRRLQVLRETKLIEAVDLEPLYRRYTNVIRRLFKVPVAVVALADLEKVYIMARAGLDGAMEAPRKGALCNGILLEDTPLVCATADVQRDPRFSHIPSFAWPESHACTPGTSAQNTSTSATAADTNTTTTSSENQSKSIRFYATVALVVDHVRIGSLCMIDSVPRPDLVDRAVRLLPDFGHILSDCMCRRHKALLGCSTELSELSMSVVYNLKYPMVNLQKSFDALGQCVAFQPSLRATRVPVYDANGTPNSGHNSPVPSSGNSAVHNAHHPSIHTSPYSPQHATTTTSMNLTAVTSARSIECIPEEQSSSSSSAQPMSPASVTSNHAFSPVSASSSGASGSSSSKNLFSMKYEDATSTTPISSTIDNTAHKTTTATTTNTTIPSTTATAANTTTNTTATTPTRNTTPVPMPQRYQKIVNMDALRAEKEILVDLLLEVRYRTMTLIKLLAHSLSVAHDLQAQYHRQAEAAVSTSYTVNNTITSIAGKRPTDEASKERVYPVGKMKTRLEHIRTNFTQSALNKNELNYTVDPALSCTSSDVDAVKFQCHSRALTLCMFSTMYHLCRVHPNSKIDVNIRFEERDYTPLHIQLANRVSSPGGNRQYITGGMHRLNSPNSSKTSTKSQLDSGKLTRIPSFANNNFNFAASTLSGSSDGVTSEQHREILLLHSRRSSIEDCGIVQSTSNTNTNNTSTTTTNTTHATHPVHPVHGATVHSDKLYTVPPPINTNTIPILNNPHLHSLTNFFASPRSSLRKNSHSKAAQICGDIYITFKVPVKSGSVRDSDSFGVKSDGILSDSDDSVSKTDPFSFDSRVETQTFENVVLRNILSTAQGGFSSSTGSEFFPDPPNPMLSSLMVFANGGTRASGMTDAMNSLPNSLKMQPHELLGIREDVSEGEYYILTVRIPCNAYPTSTATTTTNNATTTNTTTSAMSSHTLDQHDRKMLTPIQSLRNFGSSGSTILNFSSASASTRMQTESSVSVIDGEGSPVPHPVLPSLFNAHTSKFNTIKFKPNISIFSPRHADVEPSDEGDETAELPLRHKQDNTSVFNNTVVKAKPKSSSAGSGSASRSIGRSVTAMISSVTHSLFGHSSAASGAEGTSVSMRSGTTASSGLMSSSSGGRSMRRVGDIRVTPTTHE